MAEETGVDEFAGLGAADGVDADGGGPLEKNFWYRLSPSVIPSNLTRTRAKFSYSVVVPFSNSSSVTGPG